MDFASETTTDRPVEAAFVFLAAGMQRRRS